MLKIRAVFEDYINGEFSEEKFAEVVRDIDEAQSVLADKESHRSEDIEGAELTVKELCKFESDEYAVKLQCAEKLVSHGLDGLGMFDVSVLEEASALFVEC